MSDELEQEIKNNLSELKLINKCAEIFIGDYLDSQKFQIDICTESLLCDKNLAQGICKQINENRIIMIEKLDLFKQECILKYKKFGKIKFKNELSSKLSELIKEYQKSIDQVNQSKRLLVLQNLSVSIQNELKTIKKILFSNKYFIFVQNTSKTDLADFGKLLIFDGVFTQNIFEHFK